MLRIAVVYPELLGTYGDSGNALVLLERARRRDLEAELVGATCGEPLPDAEIYLLGGGEDGPQRLAVESLRADGSLFGRVEDGAVVLAVCAGLQIVGERFDLAREGDVAGIGLIPLVTRRSSVRRVGELMVETPMGTLVGFENHGGVSTLDGAAGLGEVRIGFGNDGRVDGCVLPGVFGTYAHGPVLALNPFLADEILAAALGRTLEPLVTLADRLHDERVGRVAQSASRRP